MENNYYKLPYISNSSISLINPEQGGSPKKYKTYVIDGKKEEDDTSSFQNGRIIHSYIENPDTFEVSDLEKPTEMMSKWVEEVYDKIQGLKEVEVDKESKVLKLSVLEIRKDKYYARMNDDTVWDKFCNEGFEYLKFLIRKEDKIIISKETKKILENVISSIKKKKLVNDILFGKGDNFGDECYNEMVILWDKDINDINLKLKSLLDRVIISPVNKTIKIIDSKTTSKPLSNFPYYFRYYRYYRQLAFYGSAIEYYMKNYYPEDIDFSEWKIEYFVVVMETFGIYECGLFTIPQDWITEGFKEYNNLLKRLSYHIKNDSWYDTLEESMYDGKIILEYDKEK